MGYARIRRGTGPRRNWRPLFPYARARQPDETTCVRTENRSSSGRVTAGRMTPAKRFRAGPGAPADFSLSPAATSRGGGGRARTTRFERFRDRHRPRGDGRLCGIRRRGLALGCGRLRGLPVAARKPGASGSYPLALPPRRRRDTAEGKGPGRRFGCGPWRSFEVSNPQTRARWQPPNPSGRELRWRRGSARHRPYGHSSRKRYA